MSAGQNDAGQVDAGQVDAGQTRPLVRTDVGLMSGYHSPQLDVNIRLNTNEAATPPPAEFDRRLREAMSTLEWNRYPDRAAIALREAIAKLESTAPARVFVANGSNEVLQTLLLAFAGPGRSVAVFEPTYAMHSQIARVVGSQVVGGARGADLTLDIDIVRSVLAQEQPAVTFVCSPNNPTGIMETRDTITAAIDAVKPHRGLLVVDEAYGQFAPESSVQLVDEDVPLVVTRTFSKTWSMAGLRLGYAIGPAWLIAELEKVVLPYHLDSFKQLAGTIALGFESEMRDRVAHIVEERGKVAVGLSDLGCLTWPSGANFILFRPPADAQQTWEALVARSVLVRNCAGWPGTDGCLRVTIGTTEENDAFLAALRDVLPPGS